MKDVLPNERLSRGRHQGALKQQMFRSRSAPEMWAELPMERRKACGQNASFRGAQPATLPLFLGGTFDGQD
jgi:hypothetical protein